MAADDGDNAPTIAAEAEEEAQQQQQRQSSMEMDMEEAHVPQLMQTALTASTPPPVSTPTKVAPVKRLMITKMKLENFKSYAGNVEIGPFHKCFSAVVGPNGSGKSNVIDALLFVFGKRASKLRLKKVSELVHRSAGFPDLDTATVSVFFQEILDTDEADGAATDNEANYIVVPDSEFRVTRTATKSNVSKYFVNDRPRSFTYVTELLQDKGIDLDNNRFLILQGEVEQIAMMKSKGPEGTNEDGLLEYLEDIIGSNVYVEPTERVWDEVERCNEVRGNKVNRVKLVEKEKAHLEGPRAEALEYLRKEKEVYMKTNILYQLWIQEASKNRELCESKRDELQAKYKAELARMEKNREELQLVEAVYQRVKSEHDEVAKELDESKTEYAEFEKHDVKLREELKYAKERQKELQSTQKKELKKQKSIEQKVLENEELLPELEKEVEKLQVKLKKQEQVLEGILEGHKEETAKLRSTMEAIQQDMEPLQTEMNALRSVIDTTETEIQLVEEPVTNAKKALKANSCGIIEAEANLRGLEEDQIEKREKLAKMKDRIVVAEQELDDVKSRDSSVAEKYREARTKAEEASGAVQSHATRNRMLRELLDASKPGMPLENAGLFGRLGDLGAIEGKYDVAISTACGALNNLVVETTSGAQACVAYLRKHNLGRTTFLILEQLGYLKAKYTQRFRGVNAPSGHQAPRLFDLVKVNDDKYLPAFYFALRDTLVANDLDEASAIAYQGRQCKYRVVTLDGQLVEMSGAMSGGGKRARSGGMSSTLASGLSEGEIRVLQEKASSLRNELEQIRDEKASLEKELSQLTYKIEQYENDVPKIELDVKATKTRLEDFRKNKSLLEKQTTLSADAKRQVEKLNNTKTAKEAEYKTTKMKVDKMAAKLAKLKEQILDVGGEKLRKEQDVARKITKQITEKTKQMTKIRVDFKSSQKNTEKNEQALKKIEEDIESAKKKIEDTREQITAMEEKALAVLHKCEAVQGQVTAKEKELRKDESKYRKLKKEYDEMASAEVDLSNSLEDCEKMLEENAKKETYWKAKLTSLHTAFITEQEHNAGVFEDETDFPSRKRQKKSKSADRDEAMDEQMEEHRENEDSDEEEDANLDVTLEKLPMLEAVALSRYSKEEMKYEISVLEQQRDELKANVNMSALTEYKQKEEEYKTRIVELEEATKFRDAKRHEYDELRRKRLEEFMTGFRIITLKLKEMYQMITLGGDAELELVDSLDPFSEGVVFSVRPSKKSWKHISNLSGGEKTLASLALVFALHHYKPTPLYVMDEIDAALDFKNVSIVGNYIKQRTRNAQFIIISLRNNMFELADRLVGIYKTKDATKSVTINPKIYEQGTTKALNGTTTPVTKSLQSSLMNSPESDHRRRSVKKARRASQQTVTPLPVQQRTPATTSTPLQDRINRSVADIKLLLHVPRATNVARALAALSFAVAVGGRVDPSKSDVYMSSPSPPSAPSPSFASKKPKLRHPDPPAAPRVSSSSHVSLTTATSSCRITSTPPSPVSCTTMKPAAIQSLRTNQRHWDVLRLLSHRTAFANETSAVALGAFDPVTAQDTLDFLQHECRVLIIGAGGLGCELLKDVVLSGFTKVDIIDMDTIDVSNLNRQFLFRPADVGKSKAECAAAFMRHRMVSRARDGRRSLNVDIVPHFKKVQDMDADFYRQFHVILSGLDNIEARRYLNSLVVSLADVNEDGEVDPSTIIPLIDGGTEGLRGQARVIIPRITSCFECSLETFPPQKSFPMCTIAETPRQPAHCIAYAFIVLWPRLFPDKKLNKDLPEHMQWIYQTAKDRAEQFGISGVTYSLTLGVVKNIIPAVASTNAIVAAMCVNEALKAMSYCSRLMNNYHMHMGATGCYSHTFQYDRKADCVVCSSQQKTLHVDPDSMTLQKLIDELCGDNFRLLKPSISSSTTNLFMQGPPALRAATSSNLTKTLRELVKDGENLTITDAVFAGDLALSLQVIFQPKTNHGATPMETKC